MKPNIFISYSRREVGFVDDLADHLEKENFNVWLDYRSLVPGKPWEEQIYKGIMNSNVILLVVSKSSITSANVEVEWRRMLKEKDKRIILIIFEAMNLPNELEKYEWVDFRGNYQRALKELERQLQLPEQEDHPVPQTGFKVPSVVWLAAALSAIVGLMSIGALWTLFIPFFLLPLSFQIIKRSFHYMQAQASLVMLPFALYFTSLFTLNDDFYYAVLYLSIASIPFVIALIYILRSPGMQRWGKPKATRPIYSRRRQAEYPNPKPSSFFVEHAPQDRMVAGEMAEALKAHGHHAAGNAGAADSVFTLVSAFKNDSEVDCQKQVVYPVILQSNDNISQQLSKVQWMDFRLGVRNLELVGKLINEPEKLLRALCIRPMGNQLVLPPTVMYLNYFIAFLAVVCIGSWFPYILQYFPEVQMFTDLDGSMIQLAISLVFFGVVSYFMGKQLIARKGPAASLAGLIGGMLILGAIIYWQISIDENVLGILELETDARGYSSYYPQVLYIAGNMIMAIYLFIKRADLRRWLPAKA